MEKLAGSLYFARMMDIPNPILGWKQLAGIKMILKNQLDGELQLYFPCFQILRGVVMDVTDVELGLL
ncbi:MAG: hypothetical protein ACHQIK_13440 [Candidatus Acidiferrales bacterium]